MRASSVLHVEVLQITENCDNKIEMIKPINTVHRCGKEA